MGLGAGVCARGCARLARMPPEALQPMLWAAARRAAVINARTRTPPRAHAHVHAHARARTHAHTHTLTRRAHAPATAERQIDGEEIKVQQPRQNRKKKVKGRIYQKLKKAADDEGEVGDVMEDIAEDKVIRIAQDQNLELRRMGNKWVGADGEEVEVEVEEEEEIELEYDSDDAQSQYTATSGVDDYEAYVREEQVFYVCVCVCMCICTCMYACSMHACMHVCI